MCIALAGCSSSTGRPADSTGGRTVASGADLPLPGEHRLDLWSPASGSVMYLRVPGFDSVDEIRGGAIIARNPRSHAIRRDVFASDRALSAQTKLTYGYTLGRLRKALNQATASTQQPGWVTEAADKTRNPTETTIEWHFGRSLATLDHRIGTTAPCATHSLGGYPLAQVSLLKESMGGHPSQASVTCAYSRNRVDPARAAAFVTLTAFPRATDAAQADLSHVAGRPAAAVNANLAGYEPAGDHSDLIVPLPRWVVVISPNFDIKPRNGWDGYLKRLRPVVAG
jgi:hypothetical protein